MARQLIVELVADAAKFTKGLDGAEKASASFGDKIGDAGKKMTLFTTVPIVGFLGAATKAAAEDEAAQAHLAKTLVNVGETHKNVLGAVNDYIEAAQKASLFTDDELRPSFEHLTVTTGSAERAMDLLDIAMDVAAGKGISLETATKAVAKASEGQFAAVNKLVPGLLDLSDKTLTADTATAKLTELFSGQASAATETAAGKAQMMTRDLGELTEELGAALIPMLNSLIDIVRPVIDWFTGLSDGTKKMIVVAALLVAAIGPLIGVITTLGTVLTFVAASPVVLIIAAIVAFGAGLVIAYQKSETFRAVVDGVFRAVATGVRAMWSVVEPILNFFIDKLDTVSEIAGRVGGVVGKLGGAAGAVGGFVGKLSPFAHGGVVPGSPGMPMPILAHGGETVVPFNRSGGGGSMVVVNVGGSVVSERSLVDAIHDGLLGKQRRTGALGLN